MAALGFSPQIRFFVVCDVFNGRSPESLTSPKLLLAISEYLMIISTVRKHLSNARVMEYQAGHFSSSLMSGLGS